MTRAPAVGLESDVARFRDYFEIDDADLARLRSLQPIFVRKIDRIMERLAGFLARHAETRAFLPDDATLARVTRLQREFFLGLLAGSLDGSYLADRKRVGEAAERIGLPTTLYVAAYAVFMSGLQDALFEEIGDPREASLAFNAFRKLAFMDQALTIERYVAAREATIASQQDAILALSTPVIRVQDRVLLLPLVGTLDATRVESATGILLGRVARDRAKVVILEISGVAEVDTASVKSLLDSASAASLLGAKTIISGISTPVAETIVRLGIDVSSVRTVGVLADAIGLALEMMRGR